MASPESIPAAPFSCLKTPIGKHTKGMANATAETPFAQRPSTFLLVLIVSISPLTMHIYLPSLPGLAADLQASDAQAQLTLSVYLFAVAVIQLIVGPVSDRFGRRPTLVWGLVLFLIATLFCRFATSIEALIIARGFQAIGGCVGMVVGRAIVRDVADRSEAASLLGYVTMGMAIAQMSGPAIGGLLDGLYGWRASFDLLFLLGACLLAIVVVTLRETHHNRQRSLSFGALARSHITLLKEPGFWAFSLTGALAAGVFFTFIGGGPLITQRDYGMAPVDYGFYFAIIAAGYALGNYLSGRYAAQIGPPRMIAWGNILGLLAIVVMAGLLFLGVIHPLALFGPMFLSSFSNGFVMPNTISGALSVRPELAGTASGINGSLMVFIGAAATVIVGTVIHLGGWPFVLIMLAFAIAALAAGMWANHLERQTN